MKAFVLSFLVLLQLNGFTQQDYFIFINSENQQPFFVHIQEKTISSSAVGHLIIPKLKDSAYQITIGFPKNQYPELDFMIRISRKDRGYQLKNLGDKGWVLFDLQSLELISPLPRRNSLAQAGYNLVKKDDEFARLMARVVSDTAVLYDMVRKEDPVVVKSEDRNIEELQVVKKEEPNVELQKDTAQVLVEPLRKPVDEVENAKVKSQIKLLEQGVTDSGYRMLIADDADRIDILIEIAKNVDPAKVEKTYANPDSTVKLAGKKEDFNDKQEVDITITADTTNVGVVRDTMKVVETPKKLVLVNSDCRSFAAESDVDKLRIKMLAETEVDSRIGAARKVFRTKCFTAAQIKGLTELFRSDEAIFKFLESAYPFVSDTSNFKTLVTLLADENYVKRFRTMVRLD